MQARSLGADLHLHLQLRVQALQRQVVIPWLAHIFGLDSGSGEWYLFWSGVGSDITELAILGGIVSIYRKHNCGVKHCPRIAHHDFTDPVTGLVHHLCRKHHPLDDGPITATKLAERYHLYLGKQRGKG